MFQFFARQPLAHMHIQSQCADCQMKINLPDGSWDLEVFLGPLKPGHEDNVFLRITGKCPESTRMLRSNSITVGITALQARELARRLMEVAAEDEAAAGERPSILSKN